MPINNLPQKGPESLQKPENIKEETKKELNSLQNDMGDLLTGNTEEDFNAYLEAEKAKGVKVTEITDADTPVDQNGKPTSETSEIKLDEAPTTSKGSASFKF